MKAETFPVTVTAQMRHGVLWEARAVAGSSAALAKLLCQQPARIGDWINFKAYPSKSWWDKNGVEVEGKLSALLGRPVTYDDLFPSELRTEAFQKVKKRQEVTRDVPLDRLIEAGAHPALPAPVESVELREAVERAIQESELNPRHVKVLRMRFGLEGGGEATLDEVAKEMGVGRERVRQMEAKALRRLRHTSCTKYLKPFLAKTA